ncbi:hypothetical protein [Stenotrophomonas rhizophila]|uniref:hypothetical protein n=1 Tax=Stenotrophomonas rhizophila TaxID=216778 RepID=UPI001E61CC71|nr:hypothetical protein [Stenotrophomonas rhizophila]MCC7634777.1 hypothetical protein [Stenotrophomonas rhizophila]MCC7665169.1 hypothetical protein [Stenotrophomonas rhizophila]
MKNQNVQGNGRVLGHLLSREELSRVSGGVNTPSQETDSWVDTGTCTLQSDDVAGNCGG